MMTRDQTAQAIRITVYVMLVVSAGAAFWFGDRLWTAAQAGDLPMWAAHLPACAFTAFVVVYTIDRLLLVKRRRYPTGRAFFQVVFALVFVGLLWPQQASRIIASRRMQHESDRAVRLLQHREADVRAASCELLGLRADIDAAAHLEPLVTDDPSSTVRDACQQAMDRLRTSGAMPSPKTPQP